MKLDIKIADQDLPVLSVVASQALQLLTNPKVTNQKIVDLICQDPSLTARVLRVANSPFYSGRIPAFTISDSIFRLGIRNLTNVIVIAATGEFFSESDPVIQYLWDHATLIAMTTSFLTKELAFKDVEEGFIAGLLHDIGKLMILRQHPQVYRPMLEQAISSKKPIQIMEDENFAYFTHMSVGGMVIRKWKLHDSIAEAARFHHDLDVKFPVCITHKRIVSLVSLSNKLCKMAVDGASPDDLPPAASLPYVQELAITDEKLRALAAAVFEHTRTRYIAIH